MKVLSTTFLIALLSLGIAACSQNQEVTTAPRTDKDLGYIVLGATRQEAQSSGLKFRVVNAKHKLLEVYDDENEVKAAFPEAKIEKNKLDNKIRLNQAAQEPITESEYISRFVSTCDQRAQLSVFARNSEELNNKDKLTGMRVNELGSMLELEAVQLDGDISEQTKFIWILSNAGMATYDRYLYGGPKLQLELKGIGQYQITLIAKDSNNFCGIAPYTLHVTSNEAYAEDEGLIDSLPPFLPDLYHIEEAGLNDSKTDRFEKIIVAVLDSGVNYNHPGLHKFIYKNEAEIPDNDYDDDGNGFKDDYTGFDFFNGDSSPMDDHGHGSHVAGLVADENAGVTSNALILPIKIGGPFGVDSASAAGAIFYAIDQGAKVLNLSFGGPSEPTLAEEQAYEYAHENDVVVVIASGNGDAAGNGINLDQSPEYPGALDMDNMIVVSASSATSKPLTSYSNYGSVVDIVAPGGDGTSPLYSAAIKNDLDIYYVGQGGTSMAAPIVAGAAAEILSINSDLTPAQVKLILVRTGTSDPELKGLTNSARHLNIDRAVQFVESL